MTTYTEKHRAYYEANKERIKLVSKKNESVWIKTPKGIYSVQKRHARSRKISWELTFDQWWNIWSSSGKWDERGTKTYQYCMCRNGDTGPYSIDNVRIDFVENNTRENYTLLGIDKLGRVQPRV